MLKREAIEDAGAIARVLGALHLQGYGRCDVELKEALAGLTSALGTGESETIAKALGATGKALEEAREETGLSGFGTLALKARFLSLLFLGFALNGQARKGRKRKG